MGHSSSWIAIPDAVIVSLVALSLASAIAVSVGQHRPWTTIPLALILGWGLWRLGRPDNLTASESAQQTAAINAARMMVLIAAAWFAVNAAGRAEYVVVNRDPGFLTLSGLWLSKNPSTDIPALRTIEAAEVHFGLMADAPQAWNLMGDMIQPQGAKMVPALISTGGWLAGDQGVFLVNVLVGAVGLLAIFSVARLFLSPTWAMVPAALVGLSVAHIGLSRAAYTEPLTLVLVMASLAWAWRAIESQRLGLALAAGVTSGATCLVRIDGAVFAASALVAFACAVALSAKLDTNSGSETTEASLAQQTFRRHALLIFAGSQVALTAIGYLSLWRWSREYVVRLWPQTQDALILYGVAVVCAVLWAASFNRAVRGERLITVLVTAAGKRGALIAGGTVTAVLLVLASRPLWTHVHRGQANEVDQFTNGVVEAFQRIEGLPIDPTRTYAESTVTWLSYYLTWPVVTLAIAGFGLATVWALRQRPAWLLVVIGLLAPTLLYLWDPEVVPDQIWAIRRFESAALPAFALVAALAAKYLVDRLAQSPAGKQNSRLPSLLMVLMLALPITTWVQIDGDDEYPVSVAMHVFTREQQGAYAQAQDLCEIAGERPILLYGTSSHFGTLRVICDVPVLLGLRELTAFEIQSIALELEQTPVVLTRSPEDLEWASPPHEILYSEIYQAEFRLQGIPRTVSIGEYSWFAGVPGPDGKLVPVTKNEPFLSD